MADASIESLSTQLREVYLNGALMESLMNGIYTTIMAATFYALVTKKGLRRASKVLMFVMLFMYTLSTIHLAQRWNLVQQAFIINGATAESVFDYMLAQPRWSVVLGSTVLCVNTLCADCVLIWRCFKVWDHSWYAIVVPVCTTIVGTVFSGISLYIQAVPETNLLDAGKAFTNSGTVYFSLTLATTVIATLLIIARIVYIGRRSNTLSRYSTVVEMIIESALLYSVNLIIFLPLQVQPNFLDGYPQSVLAQITGIAPMLIVARTSLGLSRPDTTWSTKEGPVMTSIEFSQSEIAGRLAHTRGNSRFVSETVLAVQSSEKKSLTGSNGSAENV